MESRGRRTESGGHVRGERGGEDRLQCRRGVETHQHQHEQAVVSVESVSAGLCHVEKGL